MTALLTPSLLVRNLLVVLLLSSFGCSEKEEVDPMKDIVGRWDLKKIYSATVRNGRVVSDDTWVAPTIAENERFGSDMTYGSYMGDKISGELGSYSLGNSVLTITHYSGLVINFRVETLTPTDLALVYEDTTRHLVQKRYLVKH
jgi:hypothetical protein